MRLASRRAGPAAPVPGPAARFSTPDPRCNRGTAVIPSESCSDSQRLSTSTSRELARPRAGGDAGPRDLAIIGCSIHRLRPVELAGLDCRISILPPHRTRAEAPRSASCWSVAALTASVSLADARRRGPGATALFVGRNAGASEPGDPAVPAPLVRRAYTACRYLPAAPFLATTRSTSQDLRGVQGTGHARSAPPNLHSP